MSSLRPLERAAIARRNTDERATTKAVRDARARCEQMLTDLDAKVAVAAAVLASNKAKPWGPRWRA